MEQLQQLVQNINILFIIVLILMVWRGWRGMKKGFVDEVNGLLSLAVSLFVIAVGILLYTSIRNKNTKNIILSILVIIVAGLVAKLLHFIAKALSEVAHLPVLNLLNAVLGIVAGAAEVVIALWIVYVIIGSFDTGSFGYMAMAWTTENELLRKLYEMNLFADWTGRINGGGI